MEVGELQERWRAQLAAAAHDSERATQEALQVMDRVTCDATEDDLAALIEAYARESAALDEYRRLLVEMHGLAADIAPPEV